MLFYSIMCKREKERKRERDGVRDRQTDRQSMWQSEDTFDEYILSFHCVCPEDLTQTSRLGGNCFFPLSLCWTLAYLYVSVSLCVCVP